MTKSWTGQAARVLARPTTHVESARQAACTLDSAPSNLAQVCVCTTQASWAFDCLCFAAFQLLLETTSTLSCWHDEAWFCHARTSFEKTLLLLLQICRFIKQIIIRSTWPQSSLNIWQLQPCAVFNGLSSSCSPMTKMSPCCH